MGELPDTLTAEQFDLLDNVDLNDPMNPAAFNELYLRDTSPDNNISFKDKALGLVIIFDDNFHYFIECQLITKLYSYYHK
jgi:hypothetical protein